MHSPFRQYHTTVCAELILAMQGASELKRFGAMQFVVALVSSDFTRELGPLLTAIAVSGRSRSAFSAGIGSVFKVWLHLSTFRSESSFRTCTMRVAINEALQIFRRERLRGACQPFFAILI